MSDSESLLLLLLLLLLLIKEKKFINTPMASDPGGYNYY